jgi:gliding motility-associated-like protein
VNSLPVIQPSVTLKNCDEDGTPDGYTDFNLTEADPYITNGDTSLIVTYYLTYNEAALGVNPINPSPFNNQNAINNEVFARVENIFGCHRISTVTLEVSTTHFPVGYMYYLDTCDEDDTIDGFETFDLTQASSDIISQFPTGQNLTVHYFRNLTDAQLTQNEILPQDSYINEVPYLQVLYVRVQSEDNGDCFGIGPHLTLTVFPRPEFEVNPNEVVCLNLAPITISPISWSDIYTYEWFDEGGNSISNLPTVTISQGGIYTAIATSTIGCVSFPETVTVIESIIASISLNDISITYDDNDTTNNTITIDESNLGIGDYEYTLNDISGFYQDEPVFENVAPGIHTIYIQDKYGCGVADIDVSVIGFPNFFTPNDDGYNDYWQIQGVSSDFYPTSLIYIFDRFGKLITQIDPSSNGWDGYYKGKQLSSSDYWFTAQLVDDEGNAREKRGHFSLIRR